MPTQAFFKPALSRSERARRKLLEAAVTIFGQKGPEGATVREIARAAGQNVAAIKYYFGSKEKLYHAVLEGLLRELRQHTAAELEEVSKLQREREPRPEQAVRLLKRLLSTIYLALLSRDDSVHLVQLVVREQLGPTGGFEILYEHGFRPLHEALCFLTGMALGSDPRSRETIVRTHTLMGQVYFFAMSREAVLRRLGWKSLEGRNADLVVRVLEQNLDTLLSDEPISGTSIENHFQAQNKR